MNQGLLKNKNSSYFKIKNEIKLYQNMPCILDKLEQDGNVKKLTKTFEKIFEQEIMYAISELKKLQEKSVFLDIKKQLISNTLIFKENLKMIAFSLSKIKSRYSLE